MKVLISAAEASSDLHGAQLLEALQREARSRGESAVEAFGMGGPRLRAAGLDARLDAGQLLAMGFSEILGKIPAALRALRELETIARERRPDVAVLIDYPEFHLKLAKRLRALGVPVVSYIPPKLWVWRQGRARKLRELFSKVLCIFPFEEELLRARGVNAEYVGNPLLDELPLQLDREEVRREFGLTPGTLALALLTGSRPAELATHLPLFVAAASQVAKRLRNEGRLVGKLQVLLPLPETAGEEWGARAHACAAPVTDDLEVRVSRGNSARCLLAADAALVKSGTSTLEAALLGCPEAVVYRPSRSTAWIFRHVIRYRGPVGLVNLVAGYKAGEPLVAREILCEGVTEHALADEAYRLLTDEGVRREMKAGFDRIRAKLREKGQPSLRAARAVREAMRS